MHTLVWPLPHRPVQLGWTCQECETHTDIALGVIEALKPSHHFKVHAPSDGSLDVLLATAQDVDPYTVTHMDRTSNGILFTKEITTIATSYDDALSKNRF